MQKIGAAFFLAVVLAQPVGLFAEQPGRSVISSAIGREAAGPPARNTMTHFANAQQSRTLRDSWITRHPVLFGALVGAGGGALIGGTAGHPCVEESFCRRPAMMQAGAAAGAGVGALAGLVVSWIR